MFGHKERVETLGANWKGWCRFISEGEPEKKVGDELAIEQNLQIP